MARLTRRSFLAGVTLAAGAVCARRLRGAVPAPALPAAEAEHVLWYDSSAREWNDALPVGNGRVGGMVLAAERTHRILLNEESFWSGEPKDFKPRDGALQMNLLLTLCTNAEGPAADGVVYRSLLSKAGESYQPLGFVTVEDHTREAVGQFRRELDLQTGIHAARVERGMAVDTFASAPDHVMVVQLEGDAGRALHCTASLGSAQHGSTRVDNDVLLLEVRAPVHVIAAEVQNANGAVTWEDDAKGRGMRATVAMCVLEQAGGRRSVTADGVRIDGARAATLLVAVRTSYAGPDKNPSREGRDATALVLRDLETARRQRTGAALRARHVADHRGFFDRVELRLDGPDLRKAPADARLANAREGAKDPGLAALYMQLGRYLLMASSRAGSLPATTQGIWTHRMRPEHDANWALDGQLPESYWLAETGNLAECHEPVFALAERLEQSGARTAERVYGVHGWVAHTSADLWCSTLPDAGGSAAAIWKCGAAWLCVQAWDAFLFSGDLAFLRAQYGRMQGASLFFLEHMRADRDGWLAAYPESSVAGPYRMPDGGVAFSTFSPAMNAAIVRELLESTAAAAALLGRDAGLQERLLEAAGQMRPAAVSRHTGELLEWPDAAWMAQDVHADQVQQVWALMPGARISLEGSPEPARAAHRTVADRAPWRKVPGSGVTGWCANAMARLGDGAGALRIVEAHLRGGVQPNLLACTGDSFAMAGNLSVAAAVAEMLLQSHAGEVHLLPALPEAWSGGSVRGLRARGGWEVSVAWQGGKARAATLSARRDGEVVLRAPKGQEIAAVRGASGLERMGDGRVRFRGVAGQSYSVSFSG